MQNIVSTLLAERDWLAGFARRLVSDAALAEDLVQETWVRALQSPPAHVDQPRGWLASVLRSLVRQRAQSEQRRTRREHDAVESSTRYDSLAGDATAALHRAELENFLAEAVARLPEDQRQAVILRFREGWKVKRIASEEAIPESTARSRIHRGLEQVREQLRERYPDNEHAWAVALVPLAEKAKRRSAAVSSMVQRISLPLAAGTVACAGVVLVLAMAPEREPGQLALPVESSFEPSITSLEPVLSGPPGSRAVVEAVPTQQSQEIFARLVDQGGHPIADRELRFLVDRKSFFARTDETGLASIQVERDGNAKHPSIGIEVSDVLLERDLRFLEDGTSKAEQVDLGTIRSERRGAVRLRYTHSKPSTKKLIGALLEPGHGKVLGGLPQPPQGCFPFLRQRISAEGDHESVLPGVVPGDYALWVRGEFDLWSVTPVTVERDRVSEVLVRGEAARDEQILELEVLTETGDPIADEACLVFAYSDDWAVVEVRETDSAGRMSFLGQENGAIDLVISSFIPGGSFDNRRVLIDSERSEPIRVVVEAQRPLQVLVLDSDATPVPGATVRLVPATSEDKEALGGTAFQAQEQIGSARAMEQPGFYSASRLARPFDIHVSLPVDGKPNTTTRVASLEIPRPEDLGEQVEIRLPFALDRASEAAPTETETPETLTVAGRVLGFGGAPEARASVVLVDGQTVVDSVEPDGRGGFWLSGSAGPEARLVLLPYALAEGYDRVAALASLAKDPRFGHALPKGPESIELPARPLVSIWGRNWNPGLSLDPWSIELESILDNPFMDQLLEGTLQKPKLERSGDFEATYAPLDRTILRLSREASAAGEQPLILESELIFNPGEQHEIDLALEFLDLEVKFPEAYTERETLALQVLTKSGFKSLQEIPGPIAAGSVRVLRDFPVGRLSLARQVRVGLGEIHNHVSLPVDLTQVSQVDAP